MDLVNLIALNAFLCSAGSVVTESDTGLSAIISAKVIKYSAYWQVSTADFVFKTQCSVTYPIAALHALLSHLHNLLLFQERPMEV